MQFFLASRERLNLNSLTYKTKGAVVQKIHFMKGISNHGMIELHTGE